MDAWMYKTVFSPLFPSVFCVHQLSGKISLQKSTTKETLISIAMT